MSDSTASRQDAGAGPTMDGGGDRFVLLDGLRGVAAFAVILDHVPGGWLGDLVPGRYLSVDFFFVLSGFVIALNYRGRFAAPDLPGTVQFYLLRLARVYPLHLVMLGLFLVNPLVILLFSGQGTPGSRYDPAYFVMSLFLVQNWGFTKELAWNIPAWSISAELFAYLVFPLMILAAARLARGVRGSLVLIGLLLGLLAAVLGAQGFDTDAGMDGLRDDVAALQDYSRATLATVPEQARVLVTAHDAFAYFGRAELFSDAMGPDTTYEGTWPGMIDHNITTIARALGGTAPERGMQGKLNAGT